MVFGFGDDDAEGFLGKSAGGDSLSVLLTGGLPHFLAVNQRNMTHKTF